MTENWIQEAKKLPLYFAQVREDALLDGRIVQKLPEMTSILMVASGSCTAAYLFLHFQTSPLWSSWT